MSSGKPPLADYLRYAGLGIEILACILVFAGGGYGLDRLMATSKPWFLLLFSLLGCAAAVYLMVRALGNPPRQ